MTNLLWDFNSLYLEDVSFVDFSGEASNSMILYLSTPSTYVDVILDHANVTSSVGTLVFSVAPEERNVPFGSSGRVVLFNVGWVEGVEYKIALFSSSGQFVGSKSVTA